MVSPYQLHQKVNQQKERTSSSSVPLLKDKPFWIWDQQEHLRLAQETDGRCCFNHVVGLPVKDKKEYPLFDYEQLLFNQLFSTNGNFRDKHLWILKSTGLGITDFFLRVIGWLCTKDDSLRGGGRY